MKRINATVVLYEVESGIIGRNPERRQKAREYNCRLEAIAYSGISPFLCADKSITSSPKDKRIGVVLELCTGKRERNDLRGQRDLYSVVALGMH